MYKSRENYAQIGQPKSFDTILEMKNYGYGDFTSFLKKEGSDYKESISILRFINARADPIGNERMKCLKKTFKIIMDSLLPDTIKLLLLVHSSEEKASDADYDKLANSSKFRY